MGYSTPQEDFWAGDFGDEYIKRNRFPGLLAERTAHLARILQSIIGFQNLVHNQ
jgi:spore coat polysaccharide biosynthesis protein SpsF